MWLYREPKLQIINFQREKLCQMYIVHIRGRNRGWQKYPIPELKKQKIGNAFPALESNLFFSCIDLWYLEHLSHSLLTLYFSDYLLFLPENSVNIFLCPNYLFLHVRLRIEIYRIRRKVRCSCEIPSLSKITQRRNKV